MQVVKLDGGRWRVDLGMRGTRGLARLAGLNIEQSTLFDVVDGRYRPLTQSTVRHALFSGKRKPGTYDWTRARATGKATSRRTAAPQWRCRTAT